MIIVMSNQATIEQRQAVIEWVEGKGYQTHISAGEEKTIIGVIGNERPIDRE